MAHVENLGTKTLYLSVDPEDIEILEGGAGVFETANGTTPLRIHFPSELLGQLPAEMACLTIEGDSLLHISVDDDCSISGLEEITVSAILGASCPGSSSLHPIELPY